MPSWRPSIVGRWPFAVFGEAVPRVLRSGPTLVLHDSVKETRDTNPDGRFYVKAECSIDRALPEHVDLREPKDGLTRKRGGSFPVLVAASPISDDAGTPVATVIEVRDVTEHTRLSERQRQSLTPERVGRMKDQFSPRSATNAARR